MSLTRRSALRILGAELLGGAFARTPLLHGKTLSIVDSAGRQPAPLGYGLTDVAQSAGLTSNISAPEARARSTSSTPPAPGLRSWITTMTVGWTCFWSM